MDNEKSDVLHGSLGLMVLRTLDTLGPQHGWGIARRIEQISGDALALNQGTLYPSLLRLEQMGWVTSKWGTSDKNRRAKFYSITILCLTIGVGATTAVFSWIEGVLLRPFPGVAKRWFRSVPRCWRWRPGWIPR